MNEEKKEAFLIARVPTEMKDRITELAKKKGINNSKLIREIVEDFLSNK